ncbi:MAG: acetyl-CoA C-acyltransferase, partial [Cyclobacteriaceae bacterium]|nr:acetyl-CoA C-acyltransferase [Cyclobacteriaceae bacterium]
FAKAEHAFSRNAEVYDSSMGARFPNPRITAKYGNESMPQTAENVALDIGVSRDQADQYALRSQEGYRAAKEDGFFDDEIVPISVPVGRRGETVIVDVDEHPRPNANLEALAALKPLFKGGTVTAGNASGINDGAAALLVGNSAAADRYGLVPRAKIISSAAAGVEPRIMGLGPVPASRLALERSGLRLTDMDVIEINEAFASQVLGCLKEMGLNANDHRVNPNGGAIALGHPTGMSGARLALTAVRELERRGGRYALVTLCIGVGQGLAVILERI